MAKKKMSPPLWRSELSRLLDGLPAGREAARVALVGVGHELRGDDAAGIAIARALQRKLATTERVLVVEGGPAPENATGLLRRFRPDLVLLADAAQIGETPGAIRLIAWQDTTGISASSHTLPLHLLSTYLAGELNCRVAILGIQPAHDELGEPLSPAVRRAVDAIVKELAALMVQ